LLADLNAQIEHAEDELAALLPHSPFATLTSLPGCAWSASAIMLLPLAIRNGGQARGWLGRREPQASDATQGSVARAAWRCVGH